MIATVTRYIKRFLILVPGLIVAYFAYFNLFPAFNQRLPGAVALLITYVLAAYILIPVGGRLFNLIVRPPEHVPLYSTTPDGLACDPVNIGVISTEQQLIRAMTKAGWQIADEKNPMTLARYMISTITGWAYPNAPFSNLYLLGRSQDLGFQLSASEDPSHRHHVRFWAASSTGDPRHLEHINFWKRYHKSDLVHQRILWVGAASLDTGLGIIRHNAQLTHSVHPDTNAERNLIVRQLKKTGLVKKTRIVKIGEPYKLTNRVLTGYLHADGKMTIIEL
jgi:hypothetical protein